MERIAVIGVGPGAEDGLTLRARAEMERAECVFAARRHAHLAPEGRLRPLEPLSEALTAIGREREAGRRVAVLVSGDTGVYSMLPLLERTFGAEAVRAVPGVSALQALCAALGESWQEACVLSGHGRELPPQALCRAVRSHAGTLLFCDKRHDPAWICRTLLNGGLGGVEVAVGERLSYADERITRGSPEELCGAEFDPMCMVRVRNPQPVSAREHIGLDDGAFERGATPMTKREIRTLALAALRLEEDSVVWDVGAGTGSVSVECARACPWGTVWAIERDEDAVELIRANVRRFALQNVEVVPGSAPGALQGLPAPTHVFLGGCGGAAGEVIALIESLGRPVRLVANAVTLESAAELMERLKGWQGLEASQVAVSRLDKVGRYRMFRAQNPVFVISADWEVKV